MHTPTVKLSSIASALLLGTITSVIGLASADAAQTRGGFRNSGFGRSSEQLRDEVNRGLMSGRLSNQEFDQIKTHEQTVQSHLQQDKARGPLTPQERTRLENAQHQVLQKTHELIANNGGHTRPPNGLGRSTQKLVKNTKQGFESGALTRQDVRDIKQREKNIHTHLQKDHANGTLTKQQLDIAKQQQNRLEQKVKQLERHQNNPTPQS